MNGTLTDMLPAVNRRRTGTDRPWFDHLLGFVRWLLARPMPYPPYGRIVLICLGLVFIAAAMALYIAERAPSGLLAPAPNDPLRATWLRWQITNRQVKRELSRGEASAP